MSLELCLKLNKLAQIVEVPMDKIWKFLELDFLLWNQMWKLKPLIKTVRWLNPVKMKFIVN